MPDLLSHLLIGLILAELFNIKKKSLVLLGAIIPDLLAKIHLIFFYLGVKHVILFESFHTPLVCILLGVLIAPLFKHDRLKTMAFISLGIVSHFLADLTMKHFITGMYLFFPFSMKMYLLDWLWPEQSVYVLAVSLLVYIAIKFVKKNRVSSIKK